MFLALVLCVFVMEYQHIKVILPCSIHPYSLHLVILFSLRAESKATALPFKKSIKMQILLHRFKMALVCIDF